jgi:uncharacterized damage-inducible protein DinB
VHIIGGEWGWLTYWKEVAPDPAFLKDLWDRHDALFHPDRFPNITEVKSKWAEVEKEQIEFANGLTNESLEKMLPIRTTQISLGNLMQHLANHSTYHRGQVALMMRQLDRTLEMRQLGWAHFAEKGLQSETEAILAEVSADGR